MENKAVYNVIKGILRIDDTTYQVMAHEAGCLFAERVHKIKGIPTKMLTEGIYSKHFWKWFLNKYDQFSQDFLFSGRHLPNELQERRKEYTLFVGARIIESLPLLDLVENEEMEVGNEHK